MSANCVGWHVAAAGSEYGQGDYNPVVAGTGVVVKPRNVGFAHST
jgi:hypothetical protein